MSRLNANELELSKSQRSVLIKFLKEIGVVAEWSKLNRADLMELVKGVVKAGGSGRFVYITESSDFDVLEAFEVWRRYQVAIHGDSEDELTLEHFEEAFVQSPLERTLQAQLRVDGKLIGVGVLDVAQSCVSSVYFY